MRVSDMIFRELRKAERSLKNLEGDLKKHPFPLASDVAAYWKTRAKEIEHEVNELKALSKIFEGAESITVTHEVGKKNDGN